MKVHYLNTARKWTLLFALIACTSMIFLDSTILSVALPTIKRDLGLTRNFQQWVINAYFLMMASVVFAGGKCADLFGRRKMLCLGMSLFAFASAYGGFASSGMALILSRGVQGIGAALMGPASIAIVMEVFPAGERGKVVGILVSISSIFLSIGPFLGGFLTEFLSWRYIFWTHIPLALLGVFLALISLPKSEKRKTSFDIAGFLSLTMGLVCFTLALMHAKQWDWDSPLTLLFIVLAVIFFFLLFLSTKFCKEPFFDLSLFKNRTFFWGNILIFCTQFLYMMTVFWPICFQTLFLFTPLQAGLLMLCSTIPCVVFAPIGGYFSDNFGPKIPTKIGFFLIITSFIWLCFLQPGDTFRSFITPLLANGCGMALVMTPIGTVTLSCFAINRNGEASGIYNTVRFSGATMGVAILGSIFTIISYYHFKHLLTLDHSLTGEEIQELWTALETFTFQFNTLSEEKIAFIQKALSKSLHFAFILGNLFVASFGFFCFVIANSKFEHQEEPFPSQ